MRLSLKISITTFFQILICSIQIDLIGIFRFERFYTTYISLFWANLKPGFVHRTNFLLRWDITPELRGFIGYEYETARGSRFFLQTPVKAVQGLFIFSTYAPIHLFLGGSSGTIANASVLLEHENMPLYVPGPSSRSGRTSSQSTGQLMRIWIAIPPGAKDLVTISPLGQFLKPCTIFFEWYDTWISISGFPWNFRAERQKFGENN